MELMPETGIFEMLMGATLVVKLVLSFLALMSLWSWSIIFHKLFTLGRVRKQVAEGYDEFQSAEDLASALQAVGKANGSPLSVVGAKAVKEYRKLEKADIERERKRMLVADILSRNLEQATRSELKRLGASVPFLATCANAAPFIGLFGTVWGIMHAFHSIGMSQSAALATVAPGISEALVATAIGLGVAIPATIAYNYFQGILVEIETEMVNFSGAFLNRVEREVSWASTRKA